MSRDVYVIGVERINISNFFSEHTVNMSVLIFKVYKTYSGLK